MAKQYQWRASTDYESDTSLSYGVTPSDSSSWKNGNIGLTESGTWTFWYRDANDYLPGTSTFGDARSSRVAVNITETWTTSADNRNNLTITTNTTINYISRDDIRGSFRATPGRYITIRRYEGGEVLYGGYDGAINVEHPIYASIPLGEYTFTLAPGESASRRTLYLYNEVEGTSSYDKIGMGVEFKNTLPKDYRPGAIKTDAGWKTHNRDSGKANILKDGSWVEMRTLGSPTEKGDSPFIRRDDEWFNQALVGDY